MLRKLTRRFKAWRYRRRIIEAAKVLSILNKVLVYAGYDRHTRRRFWRSMSNGPEDVIKELKNIATQLKD